MVSVSVVGSLSGRSLSYCLARTLPSSDDGCKHVDGSMAANLTKCFFPSLQERVINLYFVFISVVWRLKTFKSYEEELALLAWFNYRVIFRNWTVG